MQTLAQLQSGKLKGSTTIKLCCGLTTLSPEIFDLADTLEILDLSGNNLSVLPDDFAKLQQLKILFLSNNQFTIFPEILGQCPQLEMIGFKANKITTISENALPVNSRWLIMTNNKLEKLPASIGNCKRMEKLMLAGNCLKELPVELSNCKNLALLRISANQLESLPDWLLQMPKLAWLAFSGNPFCKENVDNKAELASIDWASLTVTKQLGEGASGIISKAIWQQDSSPTQTVAVKVFKGELTSDGLPEHEMDACLLAGTHPNLVNLFGKISNHPAQQKGLVLGLIPPIYRNLGQPPSFATCTRDVFTEGISFTKQETIIIATSIASVAAHLHNRGIMHGDLYAHNILTNPDAHTLIGDFGAATVYATTETQISYLLERIEVFAFGCLLEDLLNLTAPNENTKALHELKAACMQEDVWSRPGFGAIMGIMNELSA
ncbi:leucine-rich repeat-containing protein kinase family protein [Parasediminibacterium sp. JCM 36343]|uniref:leucine-rich repeat-containing protein kinase family protein n=1 Tax=Parasediminibacterium sp. JCM 36343 TaxID=3374279 RepID=UPI003978D3F0